MEIEERLRDPKRAKCRRVEGMVKSPREKLFISKEKNSIDPGLAGR